jgi:hypothetical protein
MRIQIRNTAFLQVRIRIWFCLNIRARLLQNSVSRHGMTGLVPNTASAHTISANAPAVIPVAARPSDGLPKARPCLGGGRTNTVVDKSDRSGAGIAVSSSNSSGCLIGNGSVAGRETTHRPPPPAVIRRPHSVDLGGLGRRPEASPGHSWLTVVPCNRVRPRDCDELPDEFRRAGIGVCFEGREQWVTKRCRLSRI